jgi:uncharacterized protein
MGAAYLVDGYNLLHAMGLMSPKLGQHQLGKARTRLLGLIAGSMEEAAAAVTVVFDGKGAGTSDAEIGKGGIQILFSTGKQEADDVIENQIRRCSAPKDLRVVSDDRRIRGAARRRHCQAMGCEAFLQWLDRSRKQRHRLSSQEPEKAERLSDQEAESWLAEFGDVERDPKLREAFESFDFGDAE